MRELELDLNDIGQLGIDDIVSKRSFAYSMFGEQNR
jgi:hypothetical protein